MTKQGAKAFGHPAQIPQADGYSRTEVEELLERRDLVLTVGLAPGPRPTPRASAIGEVRHLAPSSAAVQLARRVSASSDFEPRSVKLADEV